MKRSILIVTILFVVAGLLDWAVYNKSNEVESEDIYQVIEDDYGNRFEEPYKIKGKYLRFEKNCNTLNFSNYRLVNGFSDIIYPKEVIIRENGISQPYFLLDDLKENHYELELTHSDTTSYLSNKIKLPTSQTFSYFELMPYFNKLDDELIMDNFDSTLPLIIDFKDNGTYCYQDSYIFYYKGDDLFLDYYTYDHSPNSDTKIYNHKKTIFSYKVKKKILDVIKHKEQRLKRINETNEYNYTGLTAVFFHNNSIKVYSDFNNFNPLYFDIKRYKVD